MVDQTSVVGTVPVRRAPAGVPLGETVRVGELPVRLPLPVHAEPITVDPAVLTRVLDRLRRL